MITLQRKELDKILAILNGKKKIIIIGCGSCATACQAGGEEQVEELKQELTKEGFTVLATKIIDEACHIPLAKKTLRELKEEAKETDAFLVLTCGSGIQTITASVKDKPVYSGTNSLFLGSTKRIGNFTEFCSLCGDCILPQTGGICPVTRCPKGILNGPCGGMDNGKCEINQDRDCVWVLIHERLKNINETDKLKNIIPPKDHSKKNQPSDYVVKHKTHPLNKNK